MAIYQRGLIDQNTADIQKKAWYNQRFDGCLNLIWMISEAEIKKEKRKMAGGEFTSHLCLFEEHKADWYIDQADISRVTGLFLKAAKRGQRFGHQVMADWRREEKLFSKMVDELERKDLANLSDQELEKLYFRFSDCYEKTLTSSSLIDGFALGSDEIIQNQINALLDNRKITANRGKIFSVLTAPAHLSFINQAEISIFQIAAKVQSVDGLRAVATDLAIQKMLASHAKKYFWTNNNYYDRHILSVRHFRSEIKTLLAGRPNLVSLIQKIKTGPARNRRAKQILLNQLHPGRQLKSLLKISEDFTYWQDERKKRTMLFTHYAYRFLIEIGERYGYTLTEMKYLARAEIRELLKGKKFSRKVLRERTKIAVAYQKGNNYEIVSGPLARVFKNRVFVGQDHSAIQDFRGLPAATGVARGHAKIVKSVKEVDKVKPGDILVAVMTRPDYIMGIKRAAAIVTDEGGITCHAAIISRELGLPCVIGTKIGTKVLKDGDLVEVNANHGWVRKIKEPL